MKKGIKFYNLSFLNFIFVFFFFKFKPLNLKLEQSMCEIFANESYFTKDDTNKMEHTGKTS